MNERTALSAVIQELCEQAEGLGYDFAVKFAPGGDGTALMYVRDLDTNDTERFVVTVERGA